MKQARKLARTVLADLKRLTYFIQKLCLALFAFVYLKLITEQLEVLRLCHPTLQSITSRNAYKAIKLINCFTELTLIIQCKHKITQLQFFQRSDKCENKVRLIVSGSFLLWC